VASKVLLYGRVNEWSAKDFVTDINALSGQNKEVHINGDGGEVRYGLACLTNLSKIKDVTLINDAEANSMYAFMFCYPATSKKCADYSTFGFHRAGYPDWVERDPELFDDAVKAELTSVNANLRKALEATVDPIKWMTETGVSLDELFSMSSRKEVIIDAQKAKRLGLVDEVFQVTPEKKKEVNALRETIEAKFSTPHKIAAQINTEKMITTAEFKTQNPEAYKKLVNSITQKANEKAEAWFAAAEFDYKAALEGFKSGKAITVTAQFEFLKKQFKAEAVKVIEGENAPPLTVEAKKALDAKEAAEKQQVAIEAALRKNLHLKTDK